ncbi:MAG: tryptophan-rich sensory protein [Clostridia bacterium]|nr:tryptophan-rich sensory protein [Clostridia bacterium]
MDMKGLRRRISAELCRVPTVPALISAAVCLVLGMLVAVSGKGYGVFLPRSTVSVILMGIFWGIFYAVIGFALGCFLFAGDGCASVRGEQTALLFLCTLVLSYTWTAVVFKAGNYLMGLMVCLAVLACLLTLFFTLRKRYFVSGALILIGCAWIFYVIYYTFSLMFFHL